MTSSKNTKLLTGVKLRQMDYSEHGLWLALAGAHCVAISKELMTGVEPHR